MRGRIMINTAHINMHPKNKYEFIVIIFFLFLNVTSTQEIKTDNLYLQLKSQWFSPLS